MQRFTLIHDGSDQGWQAAYLAFHIAARLGSPLLVLLVNSAADKETLIQRSAQVKVGGRAAGLAIETRLVMEFSIDMVLANVSSIDGLFVPQRLIPNEETAERLLEALPCPMWVVAKDSETYEMAVLVDDFAADEKAISYATNLSHRIQQPLTGLIRESEFELTSDVDASITWIPLPNFSSVEVSTAMNQLGAGLLFLPVSRFSLVKELPFTCVICPLIQNA